MWPMFSVRGTAGVTLMLFVAACQISSAAEFTKSPLPQANGVDAIEVLGDLLAGDERKFIDTAIESTNAAVIFHSRGGNLIAGIEIGRAIRLKGFMTVVPDNHLCASACAL